MDEDISIINTNTRNEKIKNFFSKNKTLLISLLIAFVLALTFFFAFKELKKRKKIEISNLYNLTIIEYPVVEKENTKDSLIKIINEDDSIYSPLSLYFIIDNEIINDNGQSRNTWHKIGAAGWLHVCKMYV